MPECQTPSRRNQRAIMHSTCYASAIQLVLRLTLVLVLIAWDGAYGFMSSEFSSTRYFTDKGLLPPLRGRGLQPLATNQTSETTPYTDRSSVLSLRHGSGVPVTYTNDPKSVYRWLSDNLPYEGCIVGFDVEVSMSSSAYFNCLCRPKVPCPQISGVQDA